MKRVKKCDVCLWILAFILIAWGTFGLTVLPGIYDNIVHKQTVLSQNKDESLGLSALMFSKPPMINTMKFFFWNVTNVDEIVYEGARPRVIETGPYTFIESEEKRYLQFRNDDTEIFYQNYKKWIYHDELSCADCEYTDNVMIPNAIQIGSTSFTYNPNYVTSDATQTIISIFLLATGENPFNMPRVGDLLFDGYNDPVLTAAHSNIVTFISDAFNGGVSIVPFPFPDMHTMAYFNGYNNSRDEQYWVKTGKDNIDDLGVIVSWADTLMLPESWWTTPQARMINGTDTGSFAKPKLTEEDVLPMFHSYLCRSFNAVYEKRTEIAGIPSMLYSVPYDEWDTTLPQNKGFRYKNYEARDYFPGWIQCPKWNASACTASPSDPIDCNDKANLCNDCCKQGKVGDTYVLPPGFFPLACYPGRMETSPFAVLWSPPHMLYSPDSVVKSVNGMAPDYDQHQPLQYDHEPYSGMITHVTYRVQVNMPIYANPIFPTNAHLPDAIVPMFYESSEAYLHDWTYTYFQVGFVFMPVFLFWLSIAEIIIGVLIGMLVFVLRARRTF
ncbi:hypothetical protein PMAYCL1PPCAC_16134 [Pristionchus mayeri]|uniref:Uncharacterized protein n=1 Tax=Pristionchus mayeri TaxID=1317129 RepID=A0AAN5CK77_9BILA|nr:hypothetical protein PMAYCL1PPCAC_16134 [Pristionchus mayeri]